MDRCGSSVFAYNHPPIPGLDNDRLFTLDPLLRCNSGEAALAFVLPCPLFLAEPLRVGVI